MNKALLDTDILSEIGKGVDKTVARNATAYRQSHGFLTPSVVSIMEVIQRYRRVGGSARIQAFRNALLTEEVLLFDQAAADLAGQIAGDLDRVGRPIGRCDPMIAALAITHGLELVTGNTSHYQRLLPLGYSLTLVNWRIQQVFCKSFSGNALRFSFPAMERFQPVSEDGGPRSARLHPTFQALSD